MAKPSPWTQLALATVAVGLLATGLMVGLPQAGEQAGGPTIGQPAPAIVGQTAAGQAWDLASLRDKRAALVVFWASW